MLLWCFLIALSFSIFLPRMCLMHTKILEGNLKVAGKKWKWLRCLSGLWAWRVQSLQVNKQITTVLNANCQRSFIVKRQLKWILDTRPPTRLKETREQWGLFIIHPPFKQSLKADLHITSIWFTLTNLTRVSSHSRLFSLIKIKWLVTSWRTVE